MYFHRFCLLALVLTDFDLLGHFQKDYHNPPLRRYRMFMRQNLPAKRHSNCSISIKIWAESAAAGLPHEDAIDFLPEKADDGLLPNPEGLSEAP